MKSSSVAIAFLFSICLAVLSACGGGGDLTGREISGDELERALRSVVENDLAIMVLPQENLGDEFANLETDEDSGFVDNQEAADGTIDPDDTASDLEQAGRINGYELSYTDTSLSALETGEGVVQVATDVSLFRDVGAASDFLAKEADDHQRFEGKEIGPSLILEEVETFAVDGLGDEAIGLRARASLGGAKLYLTSVSFRLDRLVGGAWLFRADDASVNSQVEAIAWALEERIKDVLLGDIGEVPVPQAEEEEASPTSTPTPVPPAPGQMHCCPEPGKWSIASWSGQNAMPIEEARAFCPHPVDAAYRIDPDTQAWKQYFDG